MLRSGTILNEKYKVNKPLKAGGMGYVYEGEYDGNKCVIKEPKIGEMIFKDVKGIEYDYCQKKIKIEATILENINHDTIVKYIDSFEENNTFFLVEEYIQGVNGLDKFSDTPSEEDEVKNYILQLLRAVKYLHNENIIHRDISPKNLIFQDEKVFLIDFGTAKYGREYREEIKSDKSTQVGTPGYTPFEQWNGLSYTQSDIFSIGRTMFSMLTGITSSKQEVGFDAAGVKRLIFPSDIKVREKLADIVAKAAEPEIRDRYETAELMIKTLETIDKPEITDKTITPPSEGPRLIVGAKTYHLKDKDYLTIGSDRYGYADILIPDPDPMGPYIEKVHGVIIREGGNYWIYDNSSRFGTFVEEGGKKVLITTRIELIEDLITRGLPPQKGVEKWLLKDGTFISLAWDPVLGEYISVQFRYK